MERSYHSNKARSRDSEKRAAKLFRGRVQPASGALPSVSLKGDVKSAYFLVDDKITAKNSFSISKRLWHKLRKEAFVNKLYPALRIEMPENVELIVLDAQTFKMLLDHWIDTP